MGLLERIVWAVPPLGNLAATYCGWQRSRQRYGRVYRATVAALRERDQWPAARLQEYQQQRLQHLVHIAAAHVPHYRELFRQRDLSAADIRTVADLPRLPALEKSLLRDDPLRCVDERRQSRKLVAMRTSGTTGIPARLYMTPESIQMNYAYFEVRCRQVAGMQFGREPYVMLGARSISNVQRSRPPFWAYNYAWKQLYMSVYHLSAQNMPAYLAALRRRPYQAIMGFPYSMQLLAQYARDARGPQIRFESAISSGEMLLPEWRATIEQTFGCRVYDQYGCSENCVFVSECPEGRLHISSDFGVVEIVDDDDQPLPVGQVGQVLCTGFLNEAQPLIRYRVGDYGALSPEPCPCGRPFPVLQSLEGRSGTALVTVDGRPLSTAWVNELLTGVDTVTEWQIVQDSIDHHRIRVVVAETFSQQDSDRLVRNLAAYVGAARIDVELVDSIERSSSGKAALLVCQVPPDEIAAVTGSA